MQSFPTRFAIASLVAHTLCLLCLDACHAQCKFNKRHTDPFTGKETVSIAASVRQGVFGADYTIEFLLREDSVRVAIAFISNMVEPGTKIVRRGERLHIRLNNRQVVVLTCIADVTETGLIMTGNTVVALNPVYRATKADLERLVNSTVTSIRAEVYGRDFDVSVKPKRGKKIREALRCFLSRI